MFSLAAPGAAMGQDKEGGRVGNSVLKKTSGHPLAPKFKVPGHYSDGRYSNNPKTVTLTPLPRGSLI